MNKSMKNQIVVYSIVLMLVVAGYLNYIENDNSVEISANTQNTTNIGDATLVSNNETVGTRDNETKIENKSDAENDETDEKRRERRTSKSGRK